MDRILNLSATALAKAICEKQISSTEVVTAFLDRIKKVNPKINAVVQLSEENAYDQATRADQALARGESLGPLHGLPITIKDSFDTTDFITTGGTKGRSDFIPSKDATVVSRLRQAGAIIVGKTNTPELTLSYDTNNLVYGQTKNPYDLSRSAGGSSGGAAAIVAAGGAAFDIGSDYGGSLRYPSHCCGVATIKPTSGRVPRTGHILPFGGVLDSFQQVGPIARFVKDLSQILPIISGPDHIDPGIVPMNLENPAKVNLKNLKIAFHADNGIHSPSNETVETVCQVAKALEDQCLSVEELRPPGIEQTYDLMLGLLSADGGASIRRMLKKAGTKEHTLPWLELAKPLDAESFDALIMRWYQFKSMMLSFFKDYDVILCPVNSFQARRIGTLGADLEAFSYCMTYNLTGWPVAVVRCKASANGLPIGVQIVANPWREDVALAVAEFIEKKFGGFEPPMLG